MEDNKDIEVYDEEFSEEDFNQVDTVQHDVRHVEFDMEMDRKDYTSLVMNSIMGKNKFAMFGCVAVIILGVGYLVFGYVGLIEMSTILKLVAYALIICDIGLFVLMNYIRRKLWASDIAYMGTKRHVTVSDDIVISETDDEDTTREFDWDGLYNGEENKSYFLMYSNTGMIVFWPKRFLTDEQIPQIRKIMKVMLQSKFKTKYKIV